MLAAMTLALGVLLSGDDAFVIEKVHGPEILSKYKHPASITELAEGELMIAFFSGSGEYTPDTAVHLTKRKKDESSWSAPVAVQQKPGVPEGNPVIWRAPDGKLWLFYVVRHGNTWSTSTISARTSDDVGKTWSESMELTREKGTLVRGQPIVLPTGEYLLGIYVETGADREFTASDTMSYFLRYSPKTGNWSESNRIKSAMGNLQPAPVVIDGNHLLAFCRRGGSYEPNVRGHIVKSESHDGGKTWSEGVDTEFPNPNAAVEMIKLKSGKILLVYNDSYNSRTPLTAAISEDGGKTFPHRRDVIAGVGDFGYPYAIQSEDGTIHLVFTSDKRSTVRYTKFREEMILGHQKPAK